MSLNLGNTTIKDIYLGGNKIKEAYLGSSKVYSSNALPADMDFIYQAKDLGSSSIPNKAPNSSFGDYLKSGSLTVNGSGASCYLTNHNASDRYLYKNLTTAQLDAMKAVSSTYTYFIRCMQLTSDTGMGGILSWRYNNGSNNTYIYMIRAYQQQLQLHTTTGNQCGSNFSLTTDRVYKVVINGSSFKAYNLDNNAEYSLTYSTDRSMGSQMRTFWAGTDEYNLTRFYAIAGIPRATTSAEDAIIKETLMNQSA